MTENEFLTALEDAHRKRCGSDRLFCYIETQLTSSEWWRLSFVEEDEPGHFPIAGDLAPLGSLDEMRAKASQFNRQRLGLTQRVCEGIVASSMSGDVERGRRGRR
jgi:hypothetical protein